MWTGGRSAIWPPTCSTRTRGCATGSSATWAPPPGDDGYTDRLYHLEITADGVRSHNAIITRWSFAAKLQRYRENDARAIN